MKKWTYLVAAGMLLGATPVFTGCIDNDEPEGISILRGAKAELLKAKASVESAKVAQVQAEAALTQAEAKVKEAEAIKIQAEAKRIEAEAKIAEAQAALLNAQTESEKARLQGIIDDNKRAQQEWEEKAAVRAAEAEAAIKEAEYKALQAKAKYQQALVSLQYAQQRVLKPYINELNTATSSYYDALDALRLAQRNVNKQAAVNEENVASKDLLTRSLKKDVSLKEGALKGYQDAQKIAEEELAAANELKASDLITKREEIEGKAEEIVKEISDLTVEAAEKVAGFYTDGRFESIKGLLKEYNDALVAPQTIAAVEFDFGDGAGYPFYAQRGKVTLPELEYSAVETDNYINELATLEYYLGEFKSWTRDENDNAWTQERIVELEGQLAELEKDITTAKKAWQEAVAAYNTNKYNTSDMTKISGYDKVVTEITAFNKAADALNKALAEQVRLERKQVTDGETRDKALEQNIKDQNTANEKVETAYQTAIGNVTATYNAKKASLKTAWDNAVKETATKKAAYDKVLAESTDIAVITAAKNAYETAQKADQEALTAYNDYTQTVEEAAIAKTRNDALAAAATAKKKADDAANDAYNKLWSNTGTDTANLKTAEAKVKETEETLDAAEESLKNASTVYNNNLSEYNYGYSTPIDLSLIESIADGTFNAKDGYVVRKTDLTASKLIVLDKAALKYVVKVRSEALFGTAIWSTNAYGDFEARLKELTDEEIINAINTTMDEIIEDGGTVNMYTYNNLCRAYNLNGDRLAIKETIRIAKSWLNNKELIQGKIDQAQKAINDLTAAYDANEEAIDAKWDAFEVAHETMLSDIAAAIEPIEKKIAETKPLLIVYSAIEAAIEGYQLAGETMWSEESIKEYIATCEIKVATAKNTVYDAETALLHAQDRLAKWNSDDLTRLEVLQDKLEEAQACVDRKKKELDNAQSALDAMLAGLAAE